MKPSVKTLTEAARARLNAVKSAHDLEEFRIAFLGKKGAVTELMQELKALPPQDRKSFGLEINELKKFIEEAVESRRNSFGGESETAAEFDETLPGVMPPCGKRHPISSTIEEICGIFQRFGFDVVSGPEIETEFHNFSALNIPLDHPARDGFDTFYTSTKHLLRSQTSTVQIRVMEKHKPPLRILAPGRVYRPDTVDASHSFMFHQIEGLWVDENVRFSDLKGILHLFLRELFGDKTKIRFRPHFFPFTEPSIEVDIQWGDRGWLEILGAGSVHPNVFKEVGYEPRQYQGFAFGLGIERIAMLRHGIHDIRYFYENDLRFLKQF
ncbi:MAG: phenylalanine--tRNA ligase subunit alpha [Omnitrophica bacterium GWA2_52_8]|nr:MAG: phenylalanine--tRNA ligase subunit alpha [Omnitrophica bacterium GWA2_52_8]